uniref:ZP domain-containing protein n=1 Tax=Panagrellus redivivus TaxID=6233 RepID=A0A7E4VLF7_PANRE
MTLSAIATVFIVLLVFEPVSTSNSNVKFVDGDAIITDAGSFYFEQSTPISVKVANYQKCKGNLRICYSAVDPSTVDGSMHCGPDHCLFHIDLANLKSQMASVKTDGNDVTYTMDKDSPLTCQMKVEDNIYSYKVTQLPHDCQLMFLDAKKPKPKESGHSTELVIIIGSVVLAGLLTIIFIVGIYFYCRCKHPKTETDGTTDSRLPKSIPSPIRVTYSGPLNPSAPRAINSKPSSPVASPRKSLIRSISKPIKPPQKSRSPIKDQKAYVKSSLPVSMDGQSPTAVSLHATSDATSQISSNIPTPSPSDVPNSTQTSPETPPMPLTVIANDNSERSVSMKDFHLYCLL